jgi:hypothetical protein
MVNSQGIRSSSSLGQAPSRCNNKPQQRPTKALSFLFLGARYMAHYFPLTRAFFAPFFDWKITHSRSDRNESY